MATRRGVIPRLLLTTGLVALGGSAARAQGPTIDTPDIQAPGSGASPFGKTPGAGGAGPQGPPDSLLGGRVGPSTAKGIPTSISSPGLSAAGLFARQGVAPTRDIPAAVIPAAGPLSMPPTEEDPGPENGLTLDQAIDLLVKN